MDKIYSRISEIEKIQKHINDHNSEVVKLNTQIFSANKYSVKLTEEIKILEDNPVFTENDNQKLKNLNDELKLTENTANDLSVQKQYHEFAASLLKDSGIKTKIIKQYLPIMNKLINKYLTSMDFFVNFNLNESFEETIKSRHRDVFSYASFSEGEKMRIDLADRKSTRLNSSHRT